MSTWNGEELSEKEDEKSCNRQEGENKEQGRMYYVTCRNRAHGPDHGHGGQDEEEDQYRGHYYFSAFPAGAVSGYAGPCSSS